MYTEKKSFLSVIPSLLLIFLIVGAIYLIAFDPELSFFSGDKEIKSISFDTTSVNLYVDDTLQLKVSYKPSNPDDTKLTWESSDEKIVRVNSDGVILAKSTGTAIITATSTNNKKASITVNVLKSPEVFSKYMEVFFLNTYNAKDILDATKDGDDYKNGFSNGEAFIVKTKDNRYVLIDTSFDHKAVIDSIYNQMKNIQKTNKVKFDYLIITHSHNDHAGGALSLINNENISFNKLIMKRESKVPSIYDKIASKFSAGNIVNLTNDGMKIDLGKYVEMYIFNTKDVFLNMACHRGVSVEYFSNINYATPINGKYYYFDGSKYPNIEILPTDKLVKKENSQGAMDNYFYATVINNNYDCNPNGNSLAILFKIKTEDGNRYMYIVGDLDNIGYDIIPLNGTYGNSTNLIYDSVSSIKYDSNTKRFTGTTKDLHHIASESVTAEKVRDFLGKELNNITIYQIGHHAANNAPDAINRLKLNRKEVFAISPIRGEPKNIANFLTARTYYYTLSNATKMYPGVTGKKGVHCYIENTGRTMCEDY